MNKKIIITSIILAVSAILIYTQLTLFVIQPIGVVPDGKTLVILRLNKTQFIDSADAICQREIGEVNLFCRIGAMGGVAGNANILFRLPYSETLYKISTDGVTYDR